MDFCTLAPHQLKCISEYIFNTFLIQVKFPMNFVYFSHINANFVYFHLMFTLVTYDNYILLLRIRIKVEDKLTPPWLSSWAKV